MEDVSGTGLSSFASSVLSPFVSRATGFAFAQNETEWLYTMASHMVPEQVSNFNYIINQIIIVWFQFWVKIIHICVKLSVVQQQLTCTLNQEIKKFTFVRVNTIYILNFANINLTN